MNRPGQRDYSSIRLTRHAIERFVERFGADPATAEAQLRASLARARRLGRNSENGAIAVLALHENQPLVAILQGTSCLTVVTWNQFESRIQEFGRLRIPRKWGRLLRRLGATPPNPGDSQNPLDLSESH